MELHTNNLTSDLPNELLIEIFSRLPAKSVGAFKCLSKPWRSYLSSQEFIKLHLSRGIHRQNLIFINKNNSLRLIASPIKNYAVSNKVELKTEHVFKEIIGSCNGLVLLHHSCGMDQLVCVLNPVTHQYVNIPDSVEVDGFGYDGCSHDYKVVILDSYSPDYFYDYDSDYGLGNTVIEVYSLKKGSWKNLGLSPYDHRTEDGYSGAYVNGAIHWMASTKDLPCRTVIACFDLAKEVMKDFPAPENAVPDNLLFNGLYVLRGCLCMVDNKHCAWVMTDLWMLKEYGLGDSWTRLTVLTRFDKNIEGISPLCFIENEDELVSEFFGYGEGLVLSDLRYGSTRSMIVDGEPANSYHHGSVFVDSLVSPMAISD